MNNDKERERFAEVMQKHGYNMTMAADAPGEYAFPPLRAAWIAWQARASQEAPSSPACVGMPASIKTWRERQKLIGTDTMKYMEEEIAELRSALAAAPVGAPEDYVLMPKRLTAENGAKGSLSGEFHEEISVTCPECEGTGVLPDDEPADCPECKGEGAVEQRVAVSWDTIKSIYKMAVEYLALQPSPDLQAGSKTNSQLSMSGFYQQEFLNWNRAQKMPSVAIAKEMGVARKAVEFYLAERGSDLQAGQDVRDAALEEAAKACEKIADKRFQEHGVREHDTGDTYYQGAAAGEYDAMDEENVACIEAIRALKSSKDSGAASSAQKMGDANG